MHVIGVVREDDVRVDDVYPRLDSGNQIDAFSEPGIRKIVEPKGFGTDETGAPLCLLDPHLGVASGPSPGRSVKRDIVAAPNRLYEKPPASKFDVVGMGPYG